MNRVSWSPLQERCLAAMGYALYRQVGVPAAAASGQATEIDFDDPLFPAIIRAAGVMPARPSEFDWQGWAASVRLPPMAALRADPSAKRALWSRLRGWRKAHPHG